ncbi:MAG: membrane dipeptidase [Proteobacteria bacterium]|nr:membrane dipeptidase [Burkholderiales bacterium]
MQRQSTDTEPPETILRRHVVVEGHRDVYEQVHRLSLGETAPLAQAIFPRLVRDGIDLTVYAIGGDSYAHSQNTGRFLETTLENIDHFLQEMARSNTTQSGCRFSLVLSREDLPREVRPRHLAVLLHLEGGKPLQGGIAQLRNFHRLGVRSLQPTWNLRNELGDGVWENRTKGGLTRFGVEVIAEMNRLGMVVDLSHMNREGFYQTLEVATAPVIVSHANACGVHDHIRNLDDAQLKAIADQGGLVGILALPFTVASREVAIEQMLQHIDYIVERVGVAHMALGMDFVKYDGPRSIRDGHDPQKAPPLIRGFEEIEDLPNLIDGLQRHGYREADIAMILGGNYLRVLATILPERPPR